MRQHAPTRRAGRAGPVRLTTVPPREARLAYLGEAPAACSYLEGMSSQQPATPAPSSGPPDSGTLSLCRGRAGHAECRHRGVALGAAVSVASGIVAPSMLALVLTIGVLPVEAWTRRHSWPGWLGTLFALVTAYAIVAVLLIGTVICLIKLVDLLPQYTNDAQDLTDDAQAGLSKLGLGTGDTKRRPQQARPRQGRRCAGGLGNPGRHRGTVLPGDRDVLLRRRSPGIPAAHAWLRRSKPELARALAGSSTAPSATWS